LTTYQILAIVGFVVVAAWYYMPPITAILPKKPELLDPIEQVVRIRDAYKDPKVTQACNSLLRVLLGVET
jgi:hypothetical protein